MNPFAYSPVNVVRYSCKDISTSGQSWINDLRWHQDDTGFPDICPYDMNDDDRTTLVRYLRAGDGSLSDEDQAFSEEVAEEIEALGAIATEAHE